IIPLFQKLENIRPFEQSMTTYFNSKGLKTIGSLDFLNPTIKYPIDDIKKKIDSIGADAVLIFIYKGTDKTQEYVPPTYYAGGWGGYWGGPYWGGGYYGGGVATGGYWTTTSVVNLKANLYTKESKDAIWTAEISVTDPKYVDQISTRISEDIYADWVQHGLIKLKK
ncbi:MAG TPA: hypothetical protein VMC08_09280, partial [Bacteroidales bacterium]|nr:hypothetical protein [Bacteroidales bacterium]